MRFLLVVLVFLLLLSNALAVSLQSHSINIALEENGDAKVSERYQLMFFAGEVEDFKQHVEENGPDLMSWNIDFPWFYPHFEKDDVGRAYIIFKEADRQLVLDYSFRNVFASLVDDSGRTVRWKLTDRQFLSFLNQAQGQIVIPQTTKITVSLPANAKLVRESLSSEAMVVDNEVILSGISTNYINIEYTITEPIASPVNPLEGITLTDSVFILAVLIVVVIGVYWHRKKLSRKIENYIVEHSEISGFEPEEDIELEA